MFWLGLYLQDSDESDLAHEHEPLLPGASAKACCETQTLLNSHAIP